MASSSDPERDIEGAIFLTARSVVSSGASVGGPLGFRVAVDEVDDADCEEDDDDENRHFTTLTRTRVPSLCKPMESERRTRSRMRSSPLSPSGLEGFGIANRRLLATIK